MARFIKLALTNIDGDGEPLPSDRDEWINLDQVTSMRSMLSHNLARRHRLKGAIPREFYPVLELRTAEASAADLPRHLPRRTRRNGRAEELHRLDHRTRPHRPRRGTRSAPPASRRRPRPMT